jgi:hypothetical protein
MRSEPKKAGTSTSINDLEEPELELVEDDPAPRSTARPEYEPAKFALDIESAEERMTQPPSPAYEMLRDSCKAMVAEEVPLDEEQILRPDRKLKTTPPPR